MMTRFFPLFLALCLVGVACGDENHGPSDRSDAGNAVSDASDRDGSTDTTHDADNACSFHAECPLGTVCNYEDECVVVHCEDCQDDPHLICLPVEEHPEGVCSRPECTNDDECDTDAGETCNEGICEAG